MTPGMDATIDRILQGLTEPQLEAVTHTEGPLLVLAGPGSGKTRVITCRAAYLACTATTSRHVLAITFTNKAANEMRERIDALKVGQGMTVCTFHALCARLLRIHHERAGVPRNFTIFDKEDRRKVIRSAVEASGFSPGSWPPARVEAHISNAKNAMISAQAYADGTSDWQERAISRIFIEYEALLQDLGALDFDDLLMRTAQLLARDEELRDLLSDRYRYLLIDEYQDTNDAQYQIAQRLSENHGNICATGDPDQSIYGWRGANIQNILSFERDYPDAKVVRLEQNYRSTKRILSAADALIAENINRKEKTLWTENEHGFAVRVVECGSSEDEARMVASDIKERLAEGSKPAHIAIFYRVNSLTRPIEEALRREGIGYQIARGVEFYNRKEIKDVLAYLRVLVNPADEISLLRIINTPARKIGDTTVRRVVNAAREKQQRVYDVLMAEDGLSRFGRAAGALRQFGELLRELAVVLEMKPREAMEHAVKYSGLGAMCEPFRGQENDPTANIDELISAAFDYQRRFPEGRVLDWLEHTSLLGDVDSIRHGQGVVTLMTLHAAKGLEFPVVYIIAVEDGMIPFRRSMDDVWPGDEEEERRLLFVGMTRAMKRLTLSRARYRMIRGREDRTTGSPFLRDLPHGEVEMLQRADSDAPRFRPRPARMPPEDAALWQVGTLVRHPLHGLGQIKSFERNIGGTKVDILFQEGGRRSMYLEYAPLERVDFDEVG
jgi:DNA helicase-2/ATP-dependent DNA helicase PcrA